MTTLTPDELERVHGGLQPMMMHAMQKAWQLGLQVQGLHTGNHAEASRHWRGRGMDIGGSPDQLHKFVEWAKGTKYHEVIYLDQFYKDGVRIKSPAGVIANHQDHVHYSF